MQQREHCREYLGEESWQYQRYAAEGTLQRVFRGGKLAVPTVCSRGEHCREYLGEESWQYQRYAAEGTP
jgi:hypothetical protein